MPVIKVIFALPNVVQAEDFGGRMQSRIVQDVSVELLAAMVVGPNLLKLFFSIEQVH